MIVRVMPHEGFNAHRLLGRLVWLKRLARGWSRQHVARLCGLAVSRIAAIERGTELSPFERRLMLALLHSRPTRATEAAQAPRPTASRSARRHPSGAASRAAHGPEPSPAGLSSGGAGLGAPVVRKARKRGVR